MKPSSLFEVASSVPTSNRNEIIDYFTNIKLVISDDLVSDWFPS